MGKRISPAKFRRFVLVGLILLLSFSLTACFDRREMDDMSFVAVIGIDRGITDKWRLTLQIPTMSAMAQTGGKTSDAAAGGSGGRDESDPGSEANQGNYSYISIEAPTFYSAINILNATVPKKLNFSHIKIIVISEDLAKSGLIEPYIAPLGRFRELRRSAHVFVVKGKAQDFIKENRPVISATLSKTFEELTEGSRFTGYYPDIYFQDFYEDMKSPFGQAITAIAAVNDLQNLPEEGEPFGTEFKTGGEYRAGKLPRFSQSKIEIWGTALFDGAKMVDELNGDETRYLLMTRGEFKRGNFNLQDPNDPALVIPLEVNAVRPPKIKVDTKGPQPVINVQVFLEGNILSIQSMLHYEQKEAKAMLESLFAEDVEKNIEKVIKRCQAKGVDVFKFGGYAARNFWTIQEFENYNWNEHFKDAAAKVDVEFSIQRTGTHITTSPVVGVNEDVESKRKKQEISGK